MKILSDNAVTKSDLTEIDNKQSRQIYQLRVAIALTFIANVALTLGIKFFA